jgi:hypothetical protein
MAWKVTYSKQAQRAKGKLPAAVVKSLAALAKEIEILGPVRGNWPITVSCGPKSTIVT